MSRTILCVDDRSMLWTDVASSSDIASFTVTEVPRIIKFLFFYFCTFSFSSPFLCSSRFFCLLVISFCLSFDDVITDRFNDLVHGGLDEDATYACEFSDTFTFQLCLDSDRYFKEPLFAYRYIYTHSHIYTHTLASNAYPLRPMRKLMIIYCFVF